MTKFLSVKKYILLLLLGYHISNAQSLELEKFFDEDLVFTNTLVKQNKVYIGSHSGLYTLNGQELKLVDRDLKGFIFIEKSQEEIKKTDKSKVEFIPNDHYISQYLPKSNRFDISLSKKDGRMYVIGSGKLFVFHIKHYLQELRGISVRSFSRSTIASYNGLYSKKDYQPLNNDLIAYSDGYVRDYNNKTFICWDGLTVFKDNELIHQFRTMNKELRPEFSLNGKKYGFIRDIVWIEEEHYLLATTTGIYSFDLGKVAIQEVAKKTTNGDPFIITQKNPLYSDQLLIWYVINGEIIGYNFPKEGEMVKVPLYTHEKIIFDGVATVYGNGFISPSIYITAEDGLYRITYANENKVTLADKEEYRTIRVVNDSLLAVSNNSGLFRYNRQTKRTEKVISAEFNQKALEVIGDSIFGGGVDGIYKLAVSDFIKYNPVKRKFSVKSIFNILSKYRDYIYLLLISLVVLWFIRRKEKAKTRNDASTIENYIIQHMNRVTVSDLRSEFNMSYNQLNSILKPFTAAQYIREARLKRIYELLNAEVDLKQIAKETGYNQQYLQKILRVQSEKKAM